MTRRSGVRGALASGFEVFLFLFLLHCPLQAGDILRGGASGPGASRKNTEARANSGAEAAAVAKVRAQDRLARTTQAVNAMRQMQASARAAAGDGGIPDGLAAGGLRVLTGANAKWIGAAAPVQSGNTVTISQSAQQALLHWETFNVGKNTTVNFDQKAGGADSGKWIAFNKVFDPSGKPSRILGQIKADGQVYIINQNGIIFGAGSQVNARTLVASSLPINDRLVEQGLLSNKDAQFLFSSLFVPGGTDGTKDFTPPTPLTADGKIGSVIVEAGATISGPVSADGNGGRVMLVGPNVSNEGTISTPSGQTILAAGLQVGVQAHDSTDPSLRGLDVWIGDVGTDAGTATNSGIIEAYTGSVFMAGKQVNQLGVIDSSTSVSLNGRIDLVASYGAVGNPNYDNSDKTGGGAPIFVNQFTGTVALGGKSVTRILPDYASTATVPGSSLPENSQINVQGLSIAMQGAATLLAPHADVTFKAGKWTYLDADNNRTVFQADGSTLEDGLVSNFDGGGQKFFYSAGQVYLDSGSLLDVSGTTDVFVPLAQSVVTVQLRGTELADSPVQRDSVVRGEKLVVDLRKTGTFNGATWVGTPLGDLTSVSGVIGHNASELTANGGTVTMQTGASIVVQPGATVDVSGGFFRNEGGRIQTTRLLRNGNLVNIEKATPDVTYDGIYDGRTTKTSAKWGVTKTFNNSLAPLGGYTEQENISGANGGSISLTAPSIVIGGNLVGQTITGPRQLDKPAEMATLSFRFQGEARYEATPTDIRFYATSPAPPEVRVTTQPSRAAGTLIAYNESREKRPAELTTVVPVPAAEDENALPKVVPEPLPEGLSEGQNPQFALSTTWWTEGGFGHIWVDNRDGEFILPAGVDVAIPAGGTLAARASNVRIDGSIKAPGGTVELTAYNYSPFRYQKLEKTDELIDQPAVDPEIGRGAIVLGRGAKINVAGMLVDDRPTARNVVTTARVLNGGSVTLEGYNIDLRHGSSIDASGGALAKTVKGVDKFTYGDGGKISILAGRDPDISTITGGSLKMDGTLAAYSANKGGSLAIRANLIQIGGQASDPTMLVLQPEFFRTGGFTSYSLTGIGKSTKPALNAADKKEAFLNPPPVPETPVGEDPKEDTYIPAIRIVENAVIEPVAEQLQVVANNKAGGKLKLERTLKSQGERQPVSLKFAATGADDAYTTEFVEARGDIVIGKGSVIRTDPGASVLIGTDETLTKTLADTVSMEGTIIAPGGTVAIFTRGEFRLAKDIKANRTYALPTIYIGPEARISTAGTVVTTPDAFGRRTGILYSGGTISIHGNIVAEAGAVLDVSGSSGVFDIHPSHLAVAGEQASPVASGLSSVPYNRQTVETRLDSDGGLLELQGSEMLFSDATLLGRAGGPTATGGMLSIFSGRYYESGSSRTSADINLIVSQSDLSLKDAGPGRGVGKRVKYADKVEINKVKFAKGDSVPAMGYFAADSFQKGGFASLDLGYKFFEDASPIAYGGNVEFRGPVTIAADNSLRVAGGGIIRADSTVNLSARYIAVGQKYREPVNPADSAFIAFKQDPPDSVDGLQYYPEPTHGTGEVHFNAPLIDVGTTVFEKTGKVTFTAAGGDIRGDGTLSVAGDITMTAGQIYPATLGEFNIFAYDYTDAAGTPGSGSVTIAGSGPRPMPYSAGGSLNIFASKITQGGTLRAPFGAINLGWDGTDYDVSTTAFDSPTNPVVGDSLTVPTAQSVVLGALSTTSVSAVDPATGIGLTIPYGLSPDGLSWIDPRGVNVTVSGLPQKRVSIAGESVTTESGSTIDIRGGGDLLAYRWLSGTGGSQDLLGDASGTQRQWGAGSTYQAGALVTYKGKTWAARRTIDPAKFQDAPSQVVKKIWAKTRDVTAGIQDIAPTPPAPASGSIYWTEVQNSYAVVPGYSAAYAPRAVNNTGDNAKVLGGDPGLTSSSLKLGDQIVIDGANGLASGTYTLLPRRYGLLPGAFLITPKSGGTFSSFSTQSDALTTSGYSVNSKSSGTYARYTTPEGATTASGYLDNAFTGRSKDSGLRSLFEVVPPEVLSARAKYEVYGANAFITGAAKGLNVDVVQRLPMDSGYLSFQGNKALQLEGSVLASHPVGGRGARVDISSDADMFVVGGAGAAPAGAKVVLRSDVLNSWGAESILIGGLRRTTEDGTIVNVRTSAVTVDNPGASLSSPEITLVSKSALTVTAGSKIMSSGSLTERSETLLLTGDGALLRVSGDKLTSTVRSSLAGSTKPLMTIGAGATISGAGVILDSTYATSLSPTTVLNASYLTLSSGQISLLLDGASGGAGSVVNPHLTLQGDLLKYVQSVESLTLSSYRTIDIYGSGTFGSSTLGSLNLFASGIRGFDRGIVTLVANDVTIGNPYYSTALAAPDGPISGVLNIDARTVKLGANAFSVNGYQSLNISAKKGLLASATGSLTVPGSLSITAPVITGSKGISYDVTAGGAISLLQGGESAGVSGGLGASLGFTGSSVAATTSILLPSGSLTLRATAGDVTIGGEINVAGSSQSFYDVTRYADAGTIKLVSDTGSVILAEGSTLNVSAHSGGGDAGTIEIRSGLGTFVNNGTLLGSASAGARSGSFLLDTGTISSFEAINNPLEKGGFFEERNIRVRTGSVTINTSARARLFSLSADAGSITLTGSARLDASGTTGGSIFLSARDNVTLQAGSSITVAAQKFNSAGKGGQVSIEAGALSNGVANAAARLNLESGSRIDLSVAEFVPGSFTTVGSSAFSGQFQGTLHLRAARNAGNNNVGVGSLLGTITGASSVLVEGYKVYTPAGGVMNTALRSTINTESLAFLGAAGVGNANETALRNRLLSGAPDPTALSSILVLSPGVEIINRTGDLTLGLANPTGSTNAQAVSAADWDLSAFRYGTKSAPGILTLRAKGDLVFNNTLSDGFTPVTASSVNGNSVMWLAPLKTIVSTLPVNTQSWSFRLTSGADLGASVTDPGAADFRSVLPLGSLAAGKGSVLVGEIYPAVPNSTANGNSITDAAGSFGLTANTIRISTDTVNRGTRFEVIRTGTGDITINAARDVQLRNQFATIYTAGVALPAPTTVFQANDFVVPILNRTPSQSGVGVTLGVAQQTYAPVWSMGGGDISISARANIGHFTTDNGLASGKLIVDSSRQMPTNWLYRRGYVDESGAFASDGGVDGSSAATRVTDLATSTAWWIDFSNFFEGVGALGGGNVELTAGNDIVNVDAFAPTNARMQGKDSAGNNLNPGAAKILELGGGDISILAGNNIDGGVYYVERGTGTLFAGGSITTNSARSPQLGILESIQTAASDSSTWLPTTLLLGKSRFEVSALKDVLLGPVANPLLLPQGLNNKFWYKTYFNTFSSDAGVDVSSFGGSVTHRFAATLPGSASANSMLNVWFTTQNLFTGAGSVSNASFFQPWLRLSEVDLNSFQGVFGLGAPNLKSSAFSGDVNIVGALTLFPSATGTLELMASGGIIGLQPTGKGSVDGTDLTVWTASTINVSDADPSQFPGIFTPIAYQKFAGRSRSDAVGSEFNPYSSVNFALQETGSFTGQASSLDVQRALHSASILHKGDSSPVRLYATGGSITGLTLFSPKVTRAIAKKDITDIAFYIQNVSKDDVSIVSAGRDIIPYNENSPLRSLASNEAKGNFIGDPTKRTSTDVLSNVLAGDIQINGPGYLEVLAGRNVDLGTGPNFTDGTGSGITSIGNFRNPFLPFSGASIIAMAGVQGLDGGAALGLSGSNLNFKTISLTGKSQKTYATDELKNIATLGTFFSLLQQAATESETTGSYATGFSAIKSLFGNVSGTGEVFTRSRDIRTSTGGAITIAAPSGGLTMASDIFGNPETPPGIVTEYGGEVSIFTNGNVNIGRTRIFTLRGGDMTIWSSTGDIAAGTAPKTVVTAPPTRVVIDTTSADVATDLGGLATGGGIGVLASVKGVPKSNVYLIAPVGTVDAGDAGIQATGDIKIAAAAVLNADNISAGGTASGVPSAPTVAAPNIGGLTSASSSASAASSAASSVANQATQRQETFEEPSTITVEVLGYGGGEEE